MKKVLKAIADGNTDGFQVRACTILVTLKGKEALRGRVLKFGFFGLKKFLDPECVDGNVVRLSKE